MPHHHHNDFTRQFVLRSRPQVMGRSVAIAADHYLAAEAGMSVARLGGNAIDIAAAIAFAQNVLKPHETSFGGECPVLYYDAKSDTVHAVSGVGRSPAAATPQWFASRGYDLIPGRGFLPAIVPAFFATWTHLLARFGTLPLAKVLTPAWELAHHGFPMYDELHAAITRLAPVFAEWPTSAAYATPAGEVPKVGTLFKNPALANTLQAVLTAESAHAHKSRAAGLQAAEDLWYRGELAKRLLDFISTTKVTDHTGQSHTALLTEHDFAEHHTTLEAPLTYDFAGTTVHKCAFTQGPVFLQQLALLQGTDLHALGGPGSADYIHHLTETAKLALADREAHYGDPDLDRPPFATLLSESYNAPRRTLIDPTSANPHLRPGLPSGKPLPYDIENVRADNARALGLPLQQALDVPFHYSESMPNSFYPRDRKPNRLNLQRRLHPDAIASLRARGHDLAFTDTYKPNPMAVAIDPHTHLRHAGVCSDSGPCYTTAW